MLATQLKRFLTRHEVTFQKVHFEPQQGIFDAIQFLEIEKEKVIRCLPITDGFTNLIAVLPLTSNLDFIKLELRLKRKFELLSMKDADRLFYDCEPGCHPPLGEPYGIPVVLDQKIEKMDSVFFQSGSHATLIHMSMEEFSFLTIDAPKFDISIPITLNQTIITTMNELDDKRMVVTVPN